MDLESDYGLGWHDFSPQNAGTATLFARAR